MVTSFVREKTKNCLMMFGNFYDTIIESTNEKIMVVLIHQTIGAKKDKETVLSLLKSFAYICEPK